MDTLTICQPSSADINQYLAITIHILVAVGFSYLLRLLYQSITWLLFSHRRPPDERDASAEENISIEATVTAPARRFSLELDFDAYDGGDLGIRMPKPAHHPRGRHRTIPTPSS